ncbi:MAG: EAL domain-containing protein [Candidatus Thiodiazotropha sp. (ex. Lucinisca nassula)]|nr:EAL domain-containing protein [Candidatus Thiodiazotropha sp. (ex. Lucinisca nassula)]
MNNSAMTIGILKSISFKLTAQLASHPLFNQYFQNISDFKSLTGFETDELLKLLEQSEQEAFDHFVVVGDRLYDKYQPPFVDIIKMIDFASKEINKAVRKRKLISTANNIDKQAEIIKNAIAKAYFFKSLYNVRLLSSQSPENPSSPLTIHLHWLEEIVAYFSGDLKDLPEVNHLECHFAAWLKRMEYELLLQSTGDDKDAQHARIYLSHRKIHQEFSYILSFVQNSDYVLAFSHWSVLYQAVLELRQNIQNLQLRYKNHEERFFFEYVDEKSDLEEQLYYFLSIRLAKWTLSSKNQQNIDQLNLQILECLSEANLDGVLYTADNEIRILLQNPNNNKDIDIPHFLEQKLHAFLFQLAKEAGLKSRAIAINLNDLNNYPKQKISMLRQLSFYKTKHSFEFITQQKVELLYQSTIEAESVSVFASKALEDGTLEVFFQPIIGVQKNKMVSLEALVRAPSKEGYLAAEAFLQYLVNEEKMIALDHFVIQKVSKYAKQLAEIVDSVSINIYPTSFQHEEIISALVLLSEVLKKHNISLVVEITEQLFMGDTSPVEYLAREHNIAFSLDDFGSGYSNLFQLIGLAERQVVKVLKIDGSLVRQIDKDDKVFEVIETITKIANTLSITPIVMEYVESEHILKKLECLNANMYFQGYFFDRPLPLEQLIEKYGSDTRRDTLLLEH